MEGKRPYRKDEVAKLFRCTPQTITRMIQRGELRAHETPKGIRITPEEVERLLDANRIAPSTTEPGTHRHTPIPEELRQALQRSCRFRDGNRCTFERSVGESPA